MRILLDENSPLGLHGELVRAGHHAERIVLSGRRGISDREIRARLDADRLLFITQDTDFFLLPPPR